MQRVIFLLLLVPFCSSFLWSQFNPVDTVSANNASQYTKKKSRPFKGPPGKAALYSLIAPGGGQVFNKDYWKVPLVLAGEGIAVYYIIENNKVYNTWNECYLSIIEEATIQNCSVENVSESDAFRIRNRARNQRELTYVFFGVAHLLNVVEAFVDKHLTLFDISDDLTFLTPTEHYIHESRIELVSIKIPLSK